MIPRRGFFGKLAGLLGLSVLPIQASEESTERKLRREKMAEKGLGPDDVQLSLKWGIETFEWQHEQREQLTLRVYIDAHGERYGLMYVMTPQEVVPNDTSMKITPTGVESMTNGIACHFQ